MRSYIPDDLLQIAAKRRWAILLPLAIGLAAVPMLAKLAPEKYRSETLILVVPQRVPESYVKATVTESIESRLPSISEQILSRSRLERIITDMDLYKSLRAREVMEDVVQAMREDVSVTMGGPKDNTDSFRVSYVNNNAEVARKVTERLASLYIDQNLKDRATQADSTSQFLDTQLQEAKQRLVDHEKKLEAYRTRHAGELPTQLQGNLQSIQNANIQLQALNESTNRALERRLLIERQIADTESLPLPDAPGSAAIQDAPTTTRQLLDRARARLAALLQVYTREHPEVVAAQRAVDELAAKVELETPLGAGSGPPEPVASPQEVAQRKRVADLKAELLVVEKQIETNRAEESQLKQTISSVQSKVDVLPARESELVELTRDYGTLQTAYSTLLMKREDSAMAADLERRQIGEQFRILDPASKPERPYNQWQRLGITSSGAVFGLLLGLLWVGLGELRDTSFRSDDEVMAAIALPVLAMIPALSSPDELRRQARRRRWLDVGGTAALIAAVSVVVIWRLL